MRKKSLLLALVLPVAGQLFAQEAQFAARNMDGEKTACQALTNLQRIVFEDNAMAVMLNSGTKLTSVRSVIFCSEGANTMKAKQSGSTLSVSQQATKASITVSGVDENTMIKLFDVNGRLLQSAKSVGTSTDIDVSLLKQGLYLIQAGNQAVKFIKQSFN